MDSVDNVKWARNHSDIVLPAGSLSMGQVRERMRNAYLSVAGRFARPSQPNFLRCFYLHYVYDDQGEAFRQQIRKLKQMGRFVSTDEVRQMVAGEKPIDGKYFHLSFDDGFDNVYRNAFPILRELEVPFAFFVPTRFVGSSDEEALRMWWMPHSVRSPTRPVDWEILREMRDGGCEVGAHTRHHTRLSDVSNDPGKLIEEVAGAKADIERELGGACDFMSWPYGTFADVDDTSFDAIRDAGFRMCFSAVRGRVVPPDCSILAVPRHHFEPEWPWSHVNYFASGGKEPE